VGHSKDLDTGPKFLMLSARHLFAMLHNGLDTLAVPVKARVTRLVRFARHGAIFMFYHALCEPGDVPGGNDGLYDRLRDAIRQLRYSGDGNPAVPQNRDERLQALNTLANIVYDQLNHEYPTNYILQLLDQDTQSPQLRVALRTRALLEPVKDILEILVNGASASDGDLFNRFESTMITHAIKSLETIVDTLRASPGGLESFQAVSTRSSAVCDIALTVLNRFFDNTSDIRSRQAYTRSNGSVLWGHFGEAWANEIIEAIRVQADHYGDHSIGGIFNYTVQFLYRMLRPYELLIQHSANETDSLKRLSCEQLEEIQDLIDRLDANVIENPMRPIFGTCRAGFKQFIDNSGGRLVEAQEEDSDAEDVDDWRA
jgi:hypothetical protein